MSNAAVINGSKISNTIVIDSLEPSYGMKLCWLVEGFGIGDLCVGQDPETGVGIFQHAQPEE